MGTNSEGKEEEGLVIHDKIYFRLSEWSKIVMVKNTKSAVNHFYLYWEGYSKMFSLSCTILEFGRKNLQNSSI